MATGEHGTPFRILVAGFGSVSHVQPRDLPNPAFEMIKRLPSSLPPASISHSHTHYPVIEIVAHPDPLPSSYHGLLQTVPSLVRSNIDAVDLILLIGVAVGQEYYSVEQSAGRDGYHEVPDLDRRTLPKGEGVKIWGRKSRETLATGVDLAAVVESWREELAVVHLGHNKKWIGDWKADEAGRRQGQQKSLPDLRHTDDVGSYVCGLLYYSTLAELVRISNERPAATTATSGKREIECRAVFLHVPLLLGDEQLEAGYEVVVALMRALAAVHSDAPR
ncbi:pyroglutamyl peptidase-like protein type I [Apiospora sp. TS-2023a]